MLFRSKTKQKRYVPISKEIGPMCNELGILEIMGLIRSKANKRELLTKKSDDEIFSDMHIFARTVTETISKRADDWDLDEELAKTLKEMTINMVWSVVAAARNGFTAMNARSTYSRHENAQVSSTEGESKSFLGIKTK